MKARPYLQQGIRKRIENGLQTDIWRDAWIPESGNFEIIIPPPDNPLFPQRLADLIDPTMETWNKSIIENYFWPVDHARIVDIPIGGSTVHDRVVWHYEKKKVSRCDLAIG